MNGQPDGGGWGGSPDTNLAGTLDTADLITLEMLSGGPLWPLGRLVTDVILEALHQQQSRGLIIPGLF